MLPGDRVALSVAWAGGARQRVPGAAGARTAASVVNVRWSSDCLCHVGCSLGVRRNSPVTERASTWEGSFKIGYGVSLCFDWIRSYVRTTRLCLGCIGTESIKHTISLSSYQVV